MRAAERAARSVPLLERHHGLAEIVERARLCRRPVNPLILIWFFTPATRCARVVCKQCLTSMRFLNTQGPTRSHRLLGGCLMLLPGAACTAAASGLFQLSQGGPSGASPLRPRGPLADKASLMSDSGFDGNSLNWATRIAGSQFLAQAYSEAMRHS